MNSKLCNRFGCCFIVIGLISGAANQAHALEYLWLSSIVGGGFLDPGNWNQTGFPGAFDNAIFDAGSTGYTVTFAGNANTAGLRIGNDLLIFDLGGNTYTITSFFDMNTDGFLSGQLTLTNGTMQVNSPARTIIGNGFPNSASTLILDGSTTNLITNELHIGGFSSVSTTGTLTLQNGADTTVTGGTSIRVGPSNTQTGVLNVNDPGSTLTCTASGMTVGWVGDGTLNVTNGGSVNCDRVSIGINPTAVGTVLVTGASSSLVTTNNINVGSSGGTASLTVSGGGNVNSSGGLIGGSATADVNITGTNSTWTMGSDNFFVGTTDIGQASLTILSGGLFDQTQSPGAFYVGDVGLLQVQAGGTLRTGGSLTPGGQTILSYPPGTGGTATANVSGSLARWDVFGAMHIGQYGPALLDVSNGGVVEGQSTFSWTVYPMGQLLVSAGGTLITPGTVNLGSNSGGVGTATTTISGTGALWDAQGQVNVGDTGDALLTVSGGGLVEQKTPIGYTVGPFGNVLIETGGIVRTGGSVTPGGFTTIGSVIGGTATVLIEGVGSLWEAFGPTGIGVGGPASLTISTNGGFNQMQDPDPFIVGLDGVVDVLGGTLTTNGPTSVGYGVGGTAQLTVSGTGARWDALGPVSIGVDGPGRVDITDPGAVFSEGNPQPMIVGPDGDFFVSNSGSLITRSPAQVGSAAGGQGRVFVITGARWDAFNSISIGENGPGLVQVTDAGSVFEQGDPSPMIVGPDGRVIIQAGGVIRSGGSVTPGGTTTIGSAAGGTASVSIDGAGSLWETFGPTDIGVSGPAWVEVRGGGGFNQGGNPDPWIVGSQATVSVVTAGTITTTNTTFGAAGAGNATIAITDAGSRWDITGSTDVGDAGSASVLITTGGVMEASAYFVGPLGAVSMLNGGQLITRGWAAIGTTAGGTASMTVSGSGSRWDTYGEVQVGVEGGPGSITVASGGVLEMQEPMIGSVCDGGSANAGALCTGDWDCEGGTCIMVLSGYPSVIGSVGLVDVQAGGTMITRGPIMADGWASGTASLVVDGASARWDIFNSVSLGEYGPASMSIGGGAVVETFDPSGLGVCCLSGVCIDGLYDSDCLVFGGVYYYSRVCAEFSCPARRGGSDGDEWGLPTDIVASGNTQRMVGRAASNFDVGPNALIDISAGSTLITRGPTNIGTSFAGSSFISPAQITVSGAGARWENSSSLTIGSNGLAHITIANGGVMTDDNLAGTSVGLDGQVFGVGTMDGDYINSGRFHPGSSPGVLTVTGDYTQSSDGQLILEIDGIAASSFDQINISGVATLDGRLVIDRDFFFVPTLGDTFTVMTYASRVGTFAQVERSSFGSGLAFQLNYNATDLTLQVVADCNFNGIPDSEDITNCAGDPDCSDCNGNGIPDACDIDLCDRANDPTCNDCNGNDIPDLCDLTGVCNGGINDGMDCQDSTDCDGSPCIGAFSADTDGNGIPDECLVAIGGGGSTNYTDGTNWIGGVPAINNAIDSYSATLDGCGAKLILDANVTVDTMNIRSCSSLDVSGGDLTTALPGGIEVNGDTTGVRGVVNAELFIRGTQVVTTDDMQVRNEGKVYLDGLSRLNVSDTLEIAAGGRVSKDPVAVAVAASIDAGTVVISGGSCAAGTNGGELVLDDKMSLNVTGDLIMKGSLETAADCLPSRGGVTPPPKFDPNGCGGGRRTGTPNVIIGGSLRIQDNVVVTTSVNCARSTTAVSEAQVLVKGDVVNHSTTPLTFDWSTGGIALSALDTHFFEVAGRDVGVDMKGFALQGCSKTLTPCGEVGTPTCTNETCTPYTNVSMGLVDIGDNATVTFVDNFDNEDYVRGAQEALYVGTLTIGAGASVTVDNCSVYYRTLIPPGFVPTLVGTAKFEPLPVTIAPPVPAVAPHDFTKDRYLSFDPSTNAGQMTALRVTRIGSATPWYVSCTLQDAGADGKLS